MKIKAKYDNATENAIRKFDELHEALVSIKTENSLSRSKLTYNIEALDEKLKHIVYNAIPISLEIEWEEGDDEIKSLYEDKL